ncbi:MAG: alpha-L-fucosidase [Limnochordia bacterium]|nr:alpha-L-fucosidase [Limnochordia bacterium]
MHVPNDDTRKVAGLATPLPKQVEWQDLEVGAIFHFDLPLFADEGYTTDGATHRIYDPARYNPSQLDTDQWLAVAKSFGARYAIFTATHHNGFLQWQSDLYPYGVNPNQASLRNRRYFPVC